MVMKLRIAIVLLIAAAFLLPSGCESPTASTTTPGTGAGTGPVVTPPVTAKDPAQIALVDLTTPDISVSGTGATETAVAKYQVSDSLGSPVGSLITLTYSLQFFPNSFTMGGTAPRLMPPAASTDANGQATVSILSGTQAGVVQLICSINVGGGRTITSQPVRINVHAGFPDQRHFTISAAQLNFPGLQWNFVTDKITVLVGDKYSNPVVGLTSVYFHTSHGVVTTDKAVTDANGFITQTLNSSNPRPEFQDSLALGSGWTWVYAQTFGDSAGKTVEDSILVLWTGRPIITKLTGPGTFTIPNGGSVTWTLRVVDKYGHPMSAGTTINPTGASLKFSGDCINLTMPDTYTGGPGLTTFTLTAADGDPTTTLIPPAETSVTLTVTHPVYGVFQVILGTGTVQ
jgi:hypothetical protein